MHAAVLRRASDVPVFDTFEEPTPGGDEVVVAVRAAALKNIDRMIAAGTHYLRPAQFPAIPGIDGVGLDPDGRRVYFGAMHPPFGAMAERSVAAPSMCFPVPPALDDATAAALPNAALSSWLPLKYRADVVPGASVLVMGATGAAGRLAVRIARVMGASRVVAAGRNPRVLEELRSSGADATVDLGKGDCDVVAAFQREMRVAPFDIVLDYLWGHPTELFLEAITSHELGHSMESARCQVIQIGESAGARLQLPASALRSSAVEIMGSGTGQVRMSDVAEALGQVYELAASGELAMPTERVPLRDVATAWTHRDLDGRRIVLVP
jgi:NADPH:quinone reductase-like Zn-dependent oxidoreductase